MVQIGYTLMSEQSGPRELVGYAQQAEAAAFDFAVMSDHYFPWLTEQGHSGYAWSMLGAVSQVTERLELMTYVTCPTMRYHPAVVAQKAATLGVLSQGRFVLGLGAGENLNEHVVGAGWPPVNVRHEMLVEAITVIRRLLDGEDVSFAGDHFRVDSARLWDLPAQPVQIAAAVSGDQGIGLLAPLADHLVAVAPEANLIASWDEVNQRPGSRKIGQLPICWDTDKDRAVERAHQQFRWFGGGWKVNAELPGPSGFAAASAYVTPEDVAGSIPCGPDLDPILDAVQEWVDAGFTDVALVQVGDEGQDAFLEMANKELVPELQARFS
ncbi:MAG: Luciferase-like monooxygenase [Marmoricola sp.]|nr:Luciferase-like monooxygenase [Marmoricola sp.]